MGGGASPERLIGQGTRDHRVQQLAAGAKRRLHDGVFLEQVHRDHEGRLLQRHALFLIERFGFDVDPTEHGGTGAHRCVDSGFPSCSHMGSEDANAQP